MKHSMGKIAVTVRLLAPAIALFFAAAPRPSAAAYELGFLNFSGFYLMQLGAFDQDGAIETRFDQRDIRHDAELHISIDERRGGFEFGGAVELNAVSHLGLEVDEGYVWLQGAFGRLELGRNYGPVDKISIFAPDVGYELDLEGDWYVFLANQVEPLAQSLESKDAAKIFYASPVFGGLQVAASYAPGWGDNEAKAGGSEFSDWIELGVRYRDRFGPFRLAAALLYSRATADKPKIADIDSVNGGVQLSYGGWTVGGGFVRGGDSAQSFGSDQNEINLGVAYTQGPFGVALNYADTEREFAAGETDQRTVLGMASYRVNRFAALDLALARFGQDFATGGSNDGWTSMLQLRLKADK